MNRRGPDDAESDQELRRLGERLAEVEALLSTRTKQTEKNWTDAKLASIAQGIYRARRKRARHFPAELFADPAWDMLLDLFVSSVAGTSVSTTSLCIAADVPHSTCLRWIALLKDHGLVSRHRVPEDKRLFLITLTAKGYRLMREALPVWAEALDPE